MSEKTACIRAEIWRMRNNHRFFEANTVQSEADALEEQIATLTEARDAADAVLREVNDWRGLDGDGISQPVLNRVRVVLGLPELTAVTGGDVTSLT